MNLSDRQYAAAMEDRIGYGCLIFMDYCSRRTKGCLMDQAQSFRRLLGKARPPPILG